jgi:hypothetical protein
MSVWNIVRLAMATAHLWNTVYAANQEVGVMAGQILERLVSTDSIMPGSRKPFLNR